MRRYEAERFGNQAALAAAALDELMAALKTDRDSTARIGGEGGGKGAAGNAGNAGNVGNDRDDGRDRDDGGHARPPLPRLFENLDAGRPDPDTHSLIQLLLDSRSHANERVSRAARSVLDKLGTAVIPHLSSFLIDPDPRTCRGAVEVLSNLGSKAVPSLLPLVEHLEPGLRWTVVVALGNIGADPRSVPVLVQALERHDLRTRVGAVEALARMAPKLPEAATALLLALASEEPQVRQKAAWAVSKLGPRAPEAIPILIEWIEDEDRDDRCCAARALGTVGARQALPQLIDLLKDPQAVARSFAADALGDLGPHARESLPELLRALRSKDHQLRCAAARAIGEIGAIAGAGVALGAALDDPKERVRQAAGQALARMGAEALEAVPAMIAAIERAPSWSEATGPLTALANLGPRARPVTKRLLRVANRHPELRDSILWALRQIDPKL